MSQFLRETRRAGSNHPTDETAVASVIKIHWGWAAHVNVSLLAGMYSSPASIFTVNALLPPGVPDLFIAVFQDELMDTPGPYRHLPSVWGGENIFTQNFCCHWYQHINPGWTTKYGHRAKWVELPFCTVSLLISTWSWSSRKCNIWNVLASHYWPTKSLCALYPQTNNFTPAKGGGGVLVRGGVEVRG